MQRLRAEGREATELERTALAGWSGWGALPQVFEAVAPPHEAAAAHAELRALLTPAEIDAARRSTINAHYTDPRYATAIWGALRAFGFDGGRVLEPGCGSGNFIGTAPAGAECIGVELDPTTAAIAHYLYPHADIRAESFADTAVAENSLDAVVGNVPFGKLCLHDKRHNPSRHSIHNHFLIKGMHLLRPGGVMAVITSRYTLDAQNPGARRELFELGDLLGAVRLPTGAHEKAAGTSTVTDVLFFQKRLPGQAPRSESFERSVTQESLGLAVNEYFHSHPEDVLGTMVRGQGEGGRPELVVKNGDDVAAQLEQALARIVARARAQGHAWEPSGATEQVLNPVALVGSARQPYGYLSTDGSSFSVVQEHGAVPFDVPKSQQAELRALLGLRDVAVALLEAEAATNDDTGEIVSLRSELNRRYDRYHSAYGPINRFSLRRTGRIDERTGEERYARVRPPQGRFRTDPFSNVVYALEHFDESEQTARKATIFHERVIARPAQRLGADNPEDALAICLDSVGHVDLDRIGRLLGVEPAEARAELGELVHEEPVTGRLVVASEYLSGNVRAKLAAATRTAAEDARFAINVAALTKVQPRDLQPAEIQANLGAAWIDAPYVEQFLQAILEDETVHVEHGFGAIWEVTSRRKDSVLATSRWGTAQYPAVEVAKSLLEQRPIRIYDTTSDGERVFNAAATLAATEKATEMAERFSDWVWEDPERAAELVRVYNDRFNAIVPRDYSTIKPSLSGLSLSFRPRDHQITAVAQSLYEPAVGLFHEVGAGKTACMVMSVMEKQRLGLVKKPVVVVPNHMLEQFAREWQQLYPQARVLAASKDDLSRERRREFVARCATNHWDAVIMTRSAFERVPVSQATEKAYLEVEVTRLDEELSQARERGQSLTLKRMEALKVRRQERLTALLDSTKDPGITFEQLGVDHLVVDEAHAYKNLSLVSSIPGMAIEGSQRATDMHQKIWYLREVVKARNVVTFATATPIANSIAEAYTMTQFLRPDVLADAGIAAFDQWAATFGKTVTSLEVAPDGSSLRMHSRFSQFHNVPELMQLWSPFANVKTAADLDLPVPALAVRPSDGARAPEVVLVQPTQALRGFVDEIAQRAEAVRQRRVTPDQDNMLAITNSGRSGALDLRLVGREADGPQKVDVAAERIAAIYERTKDVRYPGPDGELHHTHGALQLVFSDLGTPSGDARWNVYDELRDLLVQRGIPRDRIRFMHEAKSDREKHALFARCREGGVSVLIGSTEKMGVGTNVQLRTVALHHLDCPWRPADIAQREGRILRQGNANPEVQILRYVTENSFDAYLWQTVARKAAFIGQVVRPSSDVRQLDGDVGEAALSYDEVKALASGNPLLLEHAQATADVRRLERLESAHYSNQNYLRRHAESGRAKMAELQRNLAAYAEAKEALTPHFELKVGVMAFDGSSKAKGNDALVKAVHGAVAANGGKTNWRAEIGRFQGLHVEAYPGWQRGSVYLGLREIPGSAFELPSDGVNAVQRLANKVDALDKVVLQDRLQFQRTEEDVARADSAKNEPFPKRSELAAARERWKALEVVLAQSTAPATPPVVEQAPQAAPVQSAEERWNALVQAQHSSVTERTARVADALQRRKAELQDKCRAHEAQRPAGLRAMFGGSGQQDAWQAAGERLARTQARVERHLEVAARIAQPGVGHHEAPSVRLARRRAAKLEPALLKEVQQVLADRAARQADQRQAQQRDVGRSLRC